MFRPENESREFTQFGVGSIITVGPRERYLVCSQYDDSLFLLDLKTFKRATADTRAVADVSHITENEARALVHSLSEGAAFSDYTYDAKGLKDK